MTRLRLGHSAINNTLHLIGTHPTGLCDHCQEESGEHAVVYCVRYRVYCVRYQSGILLHWRPMWGALHGRRGGGRATHPCKLPGAVHGGL